MQHAVENCMQEQDQEPEYTINCRIFLWTNLQMNLINQLIEVIGVEARAETDDIPDEEIEEHVQFGDD